MGPKDAELLTERELELMHVFWNGQEMTAHAARDRLEESGRPLTYTTVANLCRLLVEKGFLKRLGSARPFTFCAVKSFREVSATLVSDMVTRLFRGSREQLILHVLNPEQLTPEKRRLLEELLDEEAGDE